MFGVNGTKDVYVVVLRSVSAGLNSPAKTNSLEKKLHLKSRELTRNSRQMSQGKCGLFIAFINNSVFYYSAL